WSAFELGENGRRRRPLALVLGFAAAWTVVSEFQSVIPAAVIVWLGLVRTYQSRPSDLRPVIGRIALAAVPCAAVLLGYNALAFGSPFHLGYASEENFPALQSGIFGITYPQWWRVRELLVGSY